MPAYAQTAVMLKEKETGKAVSEEDAMGACVPRSANACKVSRCFASTGETRGRSTGREMAVIEGFLPRQLSAKSSRTKVREYLGTIRTSIMPANSRAR